MSTLFHHTHIRPRHMDSDVHRINPVHKKPREPDCKVNFLPEMDTLQLSHSQDEEHPPEMQASWWKLETLVLHLALVWTMLSLHHHCAPALQCTPRRTLLSQNCGQIWLADIVNYFSSVRFGLIMVMGLRSMMKELHTLRMPFPPPPQDALIMAG